MNSSRGNNNLMFLMVGFLLLAVASPLPSARYNSVRRLWGVKGVNGEPLSSCISSLPRGGSEVPGSEAGEDDADKEETPAEAEPVAVEETEPEPVAVEEVETAAEPVAVEEAEPEAAEDDEEEEDDDEEEDDEDEEGKKDITSMEPITVLIKTNMNNKVVDQSLELNAVRTRNIESIKKSLSRQLPGKPPMETIRLMQHGQILRDEILVDELMDDDDEDDEDEEDDEEQKASLILSLDMVPPVDPRYSTLLGETLPDMTNADLLEAYTLNEASIWYSSQEMVKEEENDEENEDEESAPTPAVNSPLVSFQLRQYASALKAQLEESVFDEKIAPLLEDPVPPAQALLEKSKQPEVKGHRTRAATTPGGPSSSVVGLKQTAQHYLNIDWGNTLKNFCLFLFFGFFGGRTMSSRAILLLGAPLCFIAQARPVKQFSKEVLYLALRNPPSIILSLLPAPQQAMLALSDEDALRMVYGDDAPIEETDEEIVADDDDEEEEQDEEDSDDDDDEDDNADTDDETDEYDSDDSEDDEE